MDLNQGPNLSVPFRRDASFSKACTILAYTCKPTSVGLTPVAAMFRNARDTGFLRFEDVKATVAEIDEVMFVRLVAALSDNGMIGDDTTAEFGDVVAAFVRTTNGVQILLANKGTGKATTMTLAVDQQGSTYTALLSAYDATQDRMVGRTNLRELVDTIGEDSTT